MYELFFLSHSLSLYLSLSLLIFAFLFSFTSFSCYISHSMHKHTLCSLSHTAKIWKTHHTMRRWMHNWKSEWKIWFVQPVELFVCMLLVWFDVCGANFFSRSYLLCLFELWAHIQSCICVFEKHIIESVWRVYVCIGHVCMCVCICYCGDDVHLFLTAQMSKWG